MRSGFNLHYSRLETRGPSRMGRPFAFLNSIQQDRLEEDLQAQLHGAGPARSEHGI